METEPEHLAVDAGANIGYTASILGVRVGPCGKASYNPRMFGQVYPELIKLFSELLSQMK